MGRQWDPESINTSTQLDANCIYQGRFRSIEEARSKPNDNSTGDKLMYKAELEVIAPPEYAGLLQRDQWTIGTEGDKNADDPETWKASIGAKSMKRAFAAAKLPMGRDIDAMIAAAIGQEVLFRVKTDKRNDAWVNVADYYAIGARAIGPIGNGTRAAAATPATPKPIVKVAAIPPANAPVQAKTIKPPKEKDIECPSCEWRGPKADFPNHASEHDDDE